MRLATIDLDGVPRAAVMLPGGTALDIATAGAKLPGAAGDALGSASVQTLIEAGPEALEALRALVVRAEAGDLADAVRPAGAFQLLSPIPVPRKNVFCVGRNYFDHIVEGEKAQKKTIGVTEHPVYFTKPLTAVIGPDAAVPIFSHVSEAIDYEVELAT